MSRAHPHDGRTAANGKQEVLHHGGLESKRLLAIISKHMDQSSSKTFSLSRQQRFKPVGQDVDDIPAKGRHGKNKMESGLPPYDVSFIAAAKCAFFDNFLHCRLLGCKNLWLELV